MANVYLVLVNARSCSRKGFIYMYGHVKTVVLVLSATLISLFISCIIHHLSPSFHHLHPSSPPPAPFMTKVPSIIKIHHHHILSSIPCTTPTHHLHPSAPFNCPHHLLIYIEHSSSDQLPLPTMLISPTYAPHLISSSHVRHPSPSCHPSSSPIHQSLFLLIFFSRSICASHLTMSIHMPLVPSLSSYARKALASQLHSI